jgi:predicted nucleic acid-binding protein
VPLILLDTDVMVEVQRGRAGPAAWLSTLQDHVALPAPVAWELLVGARDRAELQRTRRFLATFDVEDVDSTDSERATQLITEHCLSSGLSLPDYIIAAQCMNRGATLYTFNLRHYRPVPGLSAAVPYQRDP